MEFTRIRIVLAAVSVALFGALSVSMIENAAADHRFVEQLNLPEARTGSVAWGDYDGDGDADLLVTGEGGLPSIAVARLYKNVGSGSFTEVPLHLPGSVRGGSAWGDYDGDGDLDFVVFGCTALSDPGDGYLMCTAGYTRIYRNDGSDTFTNIEANLPALWYGSAAWGDYDNDGDRDLLLTGSALPTPNFGTMNPVSRVYRNDGAGVFTPLDVGLPQVFHGDAAWGDYNGDSRLDILVAGCLLNNSDPGFVVCGDNVAEVYQGNADGTFTDMNAGLDGVYDRGDVEWADYDDDGDLDVTYTGTSNSFGEIFRFYRNNADGTFTKVNTDIPGTRWGSIAWADYDKDGDDDLSITGTRTGGTSISRIYRNDGGLFTDLALNLTGVSFSDSAWADYDGDTFPDLIVIGNAGNGVTYDTFLYHNNGNQTFTNIAEPFVGTNLSDHSWGDFDRDGDDDLVVTGSSAIYRNNGNRTFTTVEVGLPAVSNGAAAWFDYDNDLDLDIFLSGAGTGGRISGVYRNNGNGTFTDIAAGLYGVAYTSVAVADYDKDGFADILYCGDGDGFGELAQATKLYKNNGNGTFTDTNAGFPSVSSCHVSWADFDNDGYVDPLVIGDDNDELAGATAVTKLYRNNQNGTFTEVNDSLPDLVFADAAWGDYDTDGDVDLLLSGRTFPNTNDSELITRVYRNNGNSTFTNLSAGLLGLERSSVAWGDYDADGKLDILVNGRDAGQLSPTKLYHNDGSNSFSEVDLGFTGITWTSASVALVDFDNDFDDDVFISGDTGNGSYTRLYRADALYDISGTITSGGAALAEVTVDGGDLGTATTNSQGVYSLSNAPSGIRYTVRPSKAGFTFDPQVRSGTLTADVTGLDFVASTASANPTATPTTPPGGSEPTPTPTPAPIPDTPDELGDEVVDARELVRRLTANRSSNERKEVVSAIKEFLSRLRSVSESNFTAKQRKQIRATAKAVKAVTSAKGKKFKPAKRKAIAALNKLARLLE